MATLTLPAEYEDAVSAILLLSDEAMAELQSALNSIPVSLNRVLSEEASSTIHLIPPSDVEEMMQTLVSLRFLKDRAGVDTDEFADDVLDAAEEQGLAEPNVFDERRDALKNRLVGILDSDAINIIARARLLLVDHEHDLCNADIATDIRPIFRSDEEDVPVAAVLVHTLKLSYHQGARIKDFYVAMDTQDLANLAETIKQGQNQAANLKPRIEAANLHYIDVE
jgi:hypothetical protein